MINKNLELYKVLLFSALVLLLCIFSFNRNHVWLNGFTLWSDVIDKNPRRAKAHNNLGVYYRSVGENLLAKNHYETAIALKPDFNHAYNNLAIINLHFEDFAEAEKNYRKAIELDPSQDAVYLNLGILFLKQDKYEEAEDALLKSCGLLQNNNNCLYYLAIAYEFQGRLSDSIKMYYKVLINDPFYADALYRLGHIYLTIKDFDNAKKIFSNYLDINPGNQDVRTLYNDLIAGSKVS